MWQHLNWIYTDWEWFNTIFNSRTQLSLKKNLLHAFVLIRSICLRPSGSWSLRMLQHRCYLFWPIGCDKLDFWEKMFLNVNLPIMNLFLYLCQSYPRDHDLNNLESTLPKYAFTQISVSLAVFSSYSYVKIQAPVWSNSTLMNHDLNKNESTLT